MNNTEIFQKKKKTNVNIFVNYIEIFQKIKKG